MNETDVELKSITDDILSKLVKLLNIDSLNMQVNTAIANTVNKHYRKGIDEVEIELDMNFGEDRSKKEFLAGYMFENIKDMNDETASKLRKELQISLMNNEPISTLKKRIKGIMDATEVRAATIARTEVNRAENQGRLDAAMQSPIKLKKYLLVAEDERTSGICKALHDKYGNEDQAIDLDKNFKANVVQGKKIVNINQAGPPFHPNCRTVVQFKQIEDNA